VVRPDAGPATVAPDLILNPQLEFCGVFGWAGNSVHEPGIRDFNVDSTGLSRSANALG